jgi:hypothetical protein
MRLPTVGHGTAALAYGLGASPPPPEPSYRLVGWGTMPLGAFPGGAVAEALGLRATFVLAAASVLALLVWFRSLTEAAIQRSEAAATTAG